MLVLSRNLYEKILIGDNVWVTIVEISRGRVRIGIEAPADIPITRGELLPERKPKPFLEKVPDGA